MQIDSLDDLYIDQLADIYDAEKRLVKVLPKMAQKASTPELRSAFEDHVQKTRHHVERLEEIFQELGRDATGKKCKAMMGLISEGKDILDKDIDPKIRDAGIVAAAQKVEHYEIAAYGTLRTLAETRGDRRAAQLLQETLDEEKEADQKLTQMAESSINMQAAGRTSR